MPRPPKIQLIYLPKQYGGRINAHTFRAICSARTDSNTSAWLMGTERINTEGSEYNDNVTSIIKSKMNGSPVIVKIQEPGRPYNRETQIMRLLSENNIPNIIQHICDFSCKDDIFRWKEPIVTPQPLCNGSGQNDIHIIVMEYIEHNLIKELYRRTLPEQVVKNIIKQLMYLVLQLWYTFRITHGDLKEGNILLDIGTAKTNTYTIGKYTRHVNTLGYEPILIDFQVAAIHNYRNTSFTFNDFILEQPLIIMRLFGSYIPNKREIEQQLESAKTLKQLLDVIDTAF